MPKFDKYFMRLISCALLITGALLGYVAGKFFLAEWLWVCFWLAFSAGVAFVLGLKKGLWGAVVLFFIIGGTWDDYRPTSIYWILLGMEVGAVMAYLVFKQNEKKTGEGEGLKIPLLGKLTAWLTKPGKVSSKNMRALVVYANEITGTTAEAGAKKRSEVGKTEQEKMWSDFFAVLDSVKVSYDPAVIPAR